MVASRFIKFIFVLEAVFLLFYSPTVAAEGMKLDLEKAIKFSLERNLDLKGKEAELGLAKGLVTKANLFLQHNPELDTDIAGRRAKKREEGERRYHTDVEVKLSQEIEIGGQPTHRRAAARKEVEKATWELRESERQVRFRVKSLFFTLLTLQEKMERGKGSVGLLDRLLDVAKNRVRVGDAPEMILAQAEFELSRAKSDILGLKREYVSNLAELRVVLSLPPEQEVTLEGRLKKKVSLPDLKTLLESALRNRPDLAAQDAERRAAEAEVNLTRSERIPNLEFSVFYSREEGNFNIFGAGVSIPLPFFDRQQGELEQALARKSIADIEYRNLRQTVEKNLRSAWERYRISEAEIDLFGENVLEKFRENLELTQRAYEEGQIEIFEAITAQDRLIEAQVRYFDVLLAFHLARAELEREAALEQ